MHRNRRRNRRARGIRSSRSARNASKRNSRPSRWFNEPLQSGSEREGAMARILFESISYYTHYPFRDSLLITASNLIVVAHRAFLCRKQSDLRKYNVDLISHVAHVACKIDKLYLELETVEILQFAALRTRNCGRRFATDDFSAEMLSNVASEPHDERINFHIGAEACGNIPHVRSSARRTCNIGKHRGEAHILDKICGMPGID